MRREPDPHRRELVVMARQDWNTIEACIAQALSANRKAKTRMVARLETVQRDFAAARRVANAAAQVVNDSD